MISLGRIYKNAVRRGGFPGLSKTGLSATAFSPAGAAADRLTYLGRRFLAFLTPPSLNRFYFSVEMEIESIPFAAFQTLANCRHVPTDPDNHGCQWYVSKDRRIAGRVYLDATHEHFRISVLHRGDSGWDVYEPRKSFEHFDDAERALRETMLESSGVKPVSLTDATPRLKWGRGRKQTKRDDGSA